MQLFNYFLITCAVWRVTYMLTSETGPYSIIEKFRNRIINYKWSPIHCFKCTSIWVCAFVCLFISHDAVAYAINVLAISAMAIFIHRVYMNE